MKTNPLNEELSLTDWLAIVVIVFALICLTLEVDKTEFKPKVDYFPNHSEIPNNNY